MVENYPYTSDGSFRQNRLHTCFKNCKDYIYDDKKVNYLIDNRPNCTDLAPTAERFLICLYDDDVCEKTVLAEEYGYGKISFAFITGIIAVLIASPLQFFYEFLCIQLVKIKQNTDKASENCKLLAFQIFMTLVSAYMYFHAISIIYSIVTVGRPGMVFSTFLFCVIFDNLKSFISLSFIYCIVVKRFMHLESNEDEAMLAEKIPKQENQIPKLKLFCLKFLESSTVENFSMIVITIYTFFVLFWLIHEGFGFKVDDNIMTKIDNVFLNFFLVEIILKSFASNFMYLKDAFSMFDALVVVLSYVLNQMNIVVKGVSVLRLIRVVVIILRKITGNQNKLRHQNKNNNPVESIIKILEQIVELEDLSIASQKECKWAIEIIETNKLYELNFDLNSEQKNMDMDAKQWLNLTTDQASDATKWFEVDLDDFLKEIHRENEEIDLNKQIEEEDRLKQLIDVNPRSWNYLIKIVDELDKWNFDVFKYYDTLGDAALLHFGVKLFQTYGLIEKFSISDNNVKNLLNAIKNETYETTIYHNTLRIIETTRNFHYFVKYGELMNHLSDLQVLAGFLSCLMHDVAHPGVDNNFLIGVKHTKALRYNDISVLENHHCAICFKLLLDPKNDIFELLSEA
jgi:hypothetical protein